MPIAVANLFSEAGGLKTRKSFTSAKGLSNRVLQVDGCLRDGWMTAMYVHACSTDILTATGVCVCDSLFL